MWGDSMTKSPRWLLGTALTFLLSPLAASRLAAEVYSLGTRSTEGPLALYSARDGVAWVEGAAGQRVRVPVPAHAEVRSFLPLAGGWLAVAEVEKDGGGRALRAWTGDLAAMRELSLPAGQKAARRQWPVALVEDGRLAGLAWLEGDGDRTLAVRAAAWDGERWGAIETVSKVGPGTQTALAGTVLADGSWLLAWSAFDGQDSEIVWSLRAHERWSPVRPVSAANAVPDVVPALVAAGHGALLSWSRYDGNDYRLRLARFADGAWLDEAVVGPPGSVEPSFAAAGGKQYVLYLAAGPARWGVLELGFDGRVERQALVARKSDARPLVVSGEWDSGGGSGLRLLWPASRREAGLDLREVP
jgi:hypothetical protein